ncbi:UNVERIFIED_CONTAM: Beta-galactosidase [Sesamum radiatum]|uniref:Beta-galactosidase n=1 Tax=Sesamum radiatum TaxID=300843 RepID=A0AAW2R421_SESRA
MASFKFLALAVILCAATFNLSADAADVSFDDRALRIDGQRKIIVSGSIHYPRSTPEMWPSLIKKAKEGGLNTIETYVFWNAHEPLHRQYDFSGNLDILRFLKVIQDEGLYAILRIGPYVCAEWNYGGFPVWLNSIPDMTFRTQNDAFMYQMKNFTTLIVDKVKEANLFASEGGPIILAQIENEYGNVIGSYGNDGKSYMNWCANFAETLDTGVPWIMCQEWDAPPSMVHVYSFFVTLLTKFSGPLFKYFLLVNYFKSWCLVLQQINTCNGWYKNWGGKDPQRTPEDLAFAVARFFQYGGTLQNYYIGNLNQPKWGHLKKLHSLIMSMEKILTYGKATSKDYGGMMSSTVFEYNGTRVCFLGNANNRDAKTIDFEGKSYTTPAWSVSILPDCVNVAYNTAEVKTQKSVLVKKLPKEAAPKRHYDLGWLWRSEHIEHLKTSVENSGPLKGVTYANQLLDQKTCYKTSIQGSKWVTNGQYNFLFETSAKPKLGTNTLSLLSVTVGLQNYGAYFDKAKNGILGPVTLVAPNSLEKDLTSNKWAYKVGLNGMERRLQEVDPRNKRKWHPSVPFDRMFVWYKTTFKTPKGEDPVVLDLYGLGKGTAWVNGHDIGRYWPSYLADDNGCVSFCDYRGAYTGSKCLTNCGKSSQRCVQTVTLGSASAHAYEGSSLELSCQGRLISKIKFASFGNGTYGSLEKGSCHSPNSLSVVKQACIGKESCSIDASEQTFGPGTCDAPMKNLAVEVQC